MRSSGVIYPYPKVTGEFETLQRICAGASIARYGDGEFKMAAHGAGIKSQRPHPALTARLQNILKDSGKCLVGIPNIHAVLEHESSTGQKIEFWTKQMRYGGILNLNRSYVSSLISRPDSAPWIDKDAYWQLLESLWVGQDVTVVRGSGKSLCPDDLVGARTITDVLCPKQHAFSDYASILERIGTPKRALICLGPTATVLAVDLCKRGVHAIDLGHVALFLRKRRRGEPMFVTDADKSHDMTVCA